jgi:hypothetical protein
MLTGCQAQDLVFDGGQAQLDDALFETCSQIRQDGALSSRVI